MNFLKKIIIKLCRSFGLELIDQNTFFSPTIGKNLIKNSEHKNKSIVIPLGKVQITNKINKLLIIFRTNSNIHIWDQNKKRIFEEPKSEYVKRSLNSLVKSVDHIKKIKDIDISLVVVNNGSNLSDNDFLKNKIQSNNFHSKIINHKNSKHKGIIKNQKTDETFGNLSSLLECFEIAKNCNHDLIYFVEDDYIHLTTCINEMIDTYERVSSQIKKELFICPSDYPFNYTNMDKCTVLIGSKRHWRTIDKTLCTFMTSKKNIDLYWDNFFKTCLDRNEPFERHLNELYLKEICISPIKSLAIHMTNMNSSYGLSPFIDYKKLWEENKND